jgi:hypothetical protein
MAAQVFSPARLHHKNHPAKTLMVGNLIRFSYPPPAKATIMNATHRRSAYSITFSPRFLSIFLPLN